MFAEVFRGKVSRSLQLSNEKAMKENDGRNEGRKEGKKGSRKEERDWDEREEGKEKTNVKVKW